MVYKPVPSSTCVAIECPAEALPRNPCSGANTHLIFSFNETRLSTRWVFLIMEVWFATIAIVLPFIKGKYSVICSAPTCRSSEVLKGKSGSSWAKQKFTEAEKNDQMKKKFTGNFMRTLFVL